jgi:hypothetical protein
MEINVSHDELRKYKIFLATPMYGGMGTGLYAKSCMDLATLCHHYGIQLVPYFLFNESLIPRARNYCVDVFMRSDCTHMMFIDADIGFNPKDVIALLALQTPESPYDIIGGPYPKKNISWEKIKVAVDKGFADDNPNNLENFVGDFVFNPKGQGSFQIGEPAEMLEIGTGFMMVRRATFEKFAAAFPEYSYRPDHVRTAEFDGSREIMMFFQAEIDVTNVNPIFRKLITELKKVTDLEEMHRLVLAAETAANIQKSKRYLSEDYWFCQKIQELGMKTWLCPWMHLVHLGTYVFGGSLSHMAALGVTPTADAKALEKTKPKTLAK